MKKRQHLFLLTIDASFYDVFLTPGFQTQDKHAHDIPLCKKIFLYLSERNCKVEQSNKYDACLFRRVGETPKLTHFKLAPMVTRIKKTPDQYSGVFLILFVSHNHYADENASSKNGKANQTNPNPASRPVIMRVHELNEPSASPA